MRAVSFAEFGPPEVLAWGEPPTPQPQPHQVRIRTRAASVNPVDGKIRRGELEAIFPTSFPAIPGSDVAGVVDLVGEAINDVAVDDEILGLAVSGSYAEHAILEEYEPRPAGMSWELAASLPVVGEAAVRLIGQLALSPGDTLAIFGAAGSVGSLVTQLAVRDGITVIGIVRDTDLEYAESLGAVPVRYGDGLVDRVRAITEVPVSAALDTSGAGVLPDAVELTAAPARVITIADDQAGEYGARFSVPTRASAAADRASEQGVSFSAPETATVTAHPLQAILAAHAAGPLVLRVANTYTLRSAVQAHRDLEAGAHGKLVLVNH
jgi:NADPH:quinone reductase-like Zn-dependent oxidoreductase